MVAPAAKTRGPWLGTKTCRKHGGFVNEGLQRDEGPWGEIPLDDKRSITDSQFQL